MSKITHSGEDGSETLKRDGSLCPSLWHPWARHPPGLSQDPGGSRGTQRESWVSLQLLQLLQLLCNFRWCDPRLASCPGRPALSVLGCSYWKAASVCAISSTLAPVGVSSKTDWAKLVTVCELPRTFQENPHPTLLLLHKLAWLGFYHLQPKSSWLIE